MSDLKYKDKIEYVYMADAVCLACGWGQYGKYNTPIMGYVEPCHLCGHTVPNKMMRCETRAMLNIREHVSKTWASASWSSLFYRLYPEYEKHMLDNN